MVAFDVHDICGSNTQVKAAEIQLKSALHKLISLFNWDHMAFDLFSKLLTLSGKVSVGAHGLVRE